MDLRRSRVLSSAWVAAGENLGLKVTALLIAVALFSIVRGAGNVQRSLDLTVTVSLPPPAPGNPVLLTQLPDKVRLTVRGSPSVIGSLRPDEIGPVQLDLRDGRRAALRLDANLVQLPAGATFVGFSPDALELHWDAMVTRVLPIRASVVGSPVPRTRVDSAVVEVEPVRVRVLGPALYVDPLAAVHTDPVDVTGLPLGRYERRITLESPRPEVSYEDVPTGVRVTFEVVPVVAERRVEALTVTPVGAARVTLRPPVVDVLVRGDPVQVEHLLPAQVVPTVEVPDGAALTRGPVAARVQVRPLPDGSEVISVTPNEVLVVPVR